MYQLVFTTNDDRGAKFAANVSESVAMFLIDYVQYAGDFQRLYVDVYDDHVTAQSYEDYGMFQSLKYLIKWLYENVFMADFTSLDKFKSWLDESYKDWKHTNAIENLAIGILAKHYCRGSFVEADTVLKRISVYMPDSIWSAVTLPSVSEMKAYIKTAFADYVSKTIKRTAYV